MNCLKTLAVAIALSLFIPAVYAEDDMDMPELMNPEELSGRAMDLLERFDTNQDKQISLDEAKAVKNAHFTRMDSDQDAKLTEAEWQQGRDKLRAEAIQRLFAKLDANKDGMLSLPEWQTIATPKPKRQAMAFAHIDANRDSNVTQEEALAFNPRAMGMGRGKGAGMSNFTQLDTNHDSVLSAEEFTHHQPAFNRFDLNHDQILSLDELEQLKQPDMGRR